MNKIKTTFQCQSCGYASPKWVGKCPDCGAWNSFSEERQRPRALKSQGAFGGVAEAQPLTSIAGGKEQRNCTGIQELDRVLGGGLVDGAIVLIGGDPGIGKSTLILQALARIADKKCSHESATLNPQRASAQPTSGSTVLYVSGEESPEQI